MRFTYIITLLLTLYKLSLILTTYSDKSVTAVISCPFYWRNIVHYRVIVIVLAKSDSIGLQRSANPCKRPCAIVECV